jgi:hypothetical protein
MRLGADRFHEHFVDLDDVDAELEDVASILTGWLVKHKPRAANMSSATPTN